MNPILRKLEDTAGIIYMDQPNLDLQHPSAHLSRGGTGGYACDEQPSLVTLSNSGIPAYLSTVVDPKSIDVLVSPMKAAEIVGNEGKYGDWLSTTYLFHKLESTGRTSLYDDFSESGVAGANFDFPQRQCVHYQVVTQWGERQLETAGLAKIDYANRLNMSSILALNKYQNSTYFFGVNNLMLFGLLNDPSLSAPIVPTTKVAGGTSWNDATGKEVLADVQKLYARLQTQVNGLIQLDSPMTLAMSPISEVALTKTTDFNVNVADTLKKNFPNLKVVTAPEYSTVSGEFVQLIVDSILGQVTATCGFTEKLRAHPIVVGMSSFKQKKSQGSWGTIIFLPMAISSMLGV